MKSLSTLAVTALCVALICGAAVGWHFLRARTAERKLAEDGKACRVLAEQGDANAQYELARLYYQGKGVPQDYTQAFDWYRKAADKGNPKAQYGVGYMYQEGKGVQQDRSQAISWYRKAADQGYAKAQYALGYSYYEGWEVTQDYAESVRWYRKAADQGYAQAQSDLGYMYVHGKGVPQDYTVGVAWYRKAADRGNARAESALGYAYSTGEGVPLDYEQSARWYRKAAKGDEYARRALDAMNHRLSVLDKTLLSIAALASMLLLVNTRESIRSRKQQRAMFAGILLLLSIGLQLYGYSHIGILQSLSAVNLFFSCRSFLVGIGFALLLSFISPQRSKVALGVCGMVFIAFDVYAALRHDLWHFARCQRAFYSLNALLIGAAITLLVLLWLERGEAPETRDTSDGIVPETVPESGTKPLGI